MPTTATTRFGRRTLLAGAGAAGLTALGACGSTAPGGSRQGGVLNIWGGVPPENGPTALCEAYEEANPGTRITYTRFVNDAPGNVKLDTALAGSTPIDLYFSYSAANLFNRAGNGLALDLSERLAGDPDLKVFAPGAAPVSNYLSDGKAFSVPAQKSPTIVYLNQTLLDRAGIKLNDTWTFDEFDAAAKELSGNGIFGTMTPPAKARLALGPDMNYAEGGKRSNFSNPVFAEDLQHRLDLQAARVCMDQKTILAEKLEAYPQSVFLNSRAAMLPVDIFVTRYIANVKENPHDFVTTAMPYPTLAEDGDEWSAATLGDHLSINPKSKFQDLAWDFLKFWMVEGGTYMIAGSRIPSLTGGASTAELTSALLGKEAEKVFDVTSFEHALFGRPLNVPVDTIFTAAPEITTIQKKYTDEVLLGSRTVESWVEAVTREADAAIAAAK